MSKGASTDSQLGKLNGFRLQEALVDVLNQFNVPDPREVVHLVKRHLEYKMKHKVGELRIVYSSGRVAKFVHVPPHDLGDFRNEDAWQKSAVPLGLAQTEAPLAVTDDES